MPIVFPLETPKLKVAISGGGPAGLAAAIAFLKLPNVDVTIYEQATELREIGGGIRIGYNSWRVLELLGVADKVDGHRKVDHQHRDGITGEMLFKYPPHIGQSKYHDIRARRTVLQAALKSQVPREIIQLRKRLQSLEQLPGGGVHLKFEDGTIAYADLVIGADGIRSAVKSSVFPAHETTWNGTTIWRCLIPLSMVDHLSISKYTAFHRGPNRMFKCSVVSNDDEVARGEGLWELTLRAYNDPITKDKKFSWGVPCTNERVADHFRNFTPEIREAIDKVPKGTWKEFSAFSGPRLGSVVASGNIALIGDASHPLLGAYGSGAGFAMEDGWLIAQIVEYYLARSPANHRSALKKALNIFDAIRSPYYARMYVDLDSPKDPNNWSSFSPLPDGPLGWIYGHDIGLEWTEVRSALDAGLEWKEIRTQLDRRWSTLPAVDPSVLALNEPDNAHVYTED